jgi:hypothetical protein
MNSSVLWLGLAQWCSQHGKYTGNSDGDNVTAQLYKGTVVTSIKESETDGVFHLSEGFA